MSITRFSLRFAPTQVKAWAARYQDSSAGADNALVQSIVPRVRQRGYLTKSDLLKIGTWKSPRIRSRVNRNLNELVRGTTGVALSARTEEVRIGVLRALYGLDWAVASVILHLMRRDRYPILDFRALWSIGTEEPPTYTFRFWWAYTQYCGTLAKRAGVSMRTLDRALWQYSKENQPSTRR